VNIDRRRDLTLREFRSTYLREKKPVVFVAAGSTWPAAKKWTLDYLRTRGATTAVKVEVGNAVQGSNPSFESTLADYIDLLQSGEAERGQLYAAGIPLFTLFPDLRDDVDFWMMGRPVIRYERGWLGPAGTVSGFHYDLGPNVLAQISGRKLVRLVSPDQDPRMYRSRKYDFLTHNSEVDPDAWDRERHPLFADADIADIELAPGDVLFIPTHWWHYTRALEASLSVNSGGAGLVDSIKLAPHAVGDVAHRMHLYRWGWCACHQPKVPRDRVLAARDEET
jgi:lysine-specific demethylase 8